jgi:hypothetical protein
VTLLLRDNDDVKTDDAPPAPPEPAPVTPACASCGAEMQPDQDWCLACGQAAPGRLGGRPGMRTAATVVALTLALAGGAVAASYAALQGDGNQQAAAPTTGAGASVAQTPAPDTTPAPTPPPAAPPAAPPAPGGGAPKTPKTTAPPAVSTPPVPSSPTPSAPAGAPKPAPKPAAPPAPTGPEPIAFGADAVTIYDPYSRATAQGDPVDAYDGDTGTAWKVAVPADSQQMAVGLVVDLGSKRKAKIAELTSGTPGFRAEVYATDSKDLPPDVLDTRWAHLKDASDVAKGKTTISLGSGNTKYRYVLLWFTTPPKEGKTVRIAELGLLG